MAEARLSASAEIFKQLPTEFQQLKLLIKLLETFAFRALARGYELGDSRLLLILEQQEVLVLKTHQLVNDVEKHLCGETTKWAVLKASFRSFKHSLSFLLQEVVSLVVPINSKKPHGFEQFH